MSETAFIIIFISVGLVIVMDLIFIACCLVLSSRCDEDKK